jgi:hypothetical protein
VFIRIRSGPWIVEKLDLLWQTKLSNESERCPSYRLINQRRVRLAMPIGKATAGGVHRRCRGGFVSPWTQTGQTYKIYWLVHHLSTDPSSDRFHLLTSTSLLAQRRGRSGQISSSLLTWQPHPDLASLASKHLDGARKKAESLNRLGNVKAQVYPESPLRQAAPAGKNGEPGEAHAQIKTSTELLLLASQLTFFEIR